MCSDRAVDIWQRERALARTTVAWGLRASSPASAWPRRPGPVAALLRAADRGMGRRRPRDRGPGLAVAGPADAKLPDAYAPAAQEAERVSLRRVLLVNAAADVGYVALGVGLARDSGLVSPVPGSPSWCRVPSCSSTTASTLRAPVPPPDALSHRQRRISTCCWASVRMSSATWMRVACCSPGAARSSVMLMLSTHTWQAATSTKA